MPFDVRKFQEEAYSQSYMSRTIMSDDARQYHFDYYKKRAASLYESFFDIYIECRKQVKYLSSEINIIKDELKNYNRDDADYEELKRYEFFLCQQRSILLRRRNQLKSAAEDIHMVVNVLTTMQKPEEKFFFIRNHEFRLHARVW